MSTDESDLIKRLIAGEENAFRELVSTHHANMLYLARNFVGDAIAEEVVQESWVSVLKALPNFQQRSSLKTWISRIVSNCALTRLRKEKRLVQFADMSDLESGQLVSDRFKSDGHWQQAPLVWEQTTPEAILESNQLREQIRSAMDHLPPIQQTILNLRDMQGLEMDEICKILDISESNSRVLLHRARTRMWQVIDKANRD